MALLHSDSFDDRPAAFIGDRYAAGGTSHEPTTGRTGLGAVISTGILDQFENLTWQSDTTHQTLYIGVATHMSQSTALCSIRHSGTPHIYAQLNSDGTISVILFGTPETTLATSSRVVPQSGFFYVEFMGRIDPSNGAYELRVDGTRWLSASGLNTSSNGNSIANQVRLTYNHTGVDDYTRIVDDFYITDDSTDGGASTAVGFLGPVKIACKNPTSAGASSQWTPLSGANYENVDETTGEDADTSFVATLTEGAIDLYSQSAFEVIDPTIKAVAVHQWAKKMDGTLRRLTPTVRIGSTNYEGDDYDLGASYDRVFHAFEKSPATGAAWTRAEVSSAQFGVILAEV